MRDGFVRGLMSVAETNSELMLLTADLGYGVFEPFEERFPSQYMNVGIAEQSMMGVAAGLALEGKCVVCYSIGNFPTMRCLEQIRNDACYHDLNISIVASGAGFSYGQLGMSHHATEDLGILRVLPGITINIPTNADEAEALTRKMTSSSGVSYLRLDKTSTKEATAIESMRTSGFRRWRNGYGICMIGIGGIVQELIDAADRLEKYGISCSVIAVNTLKPFDIDEFFYLIGDSTDLIVVEEHNIIGGLNSAIAEAVAKSDKTKIRTYPVGIPDVYSTTVGDQSYLRRLYGLDSESISELVIRISKGKFS